MAVSVGPRKRGAKLPQEMSGEACQVWLEKLGSLLEGGPFL